MLARLSDERRRRAELDLTEEDMIVMIITDGYENASREYTQGHIFEAIEKRREEGWAFLFLGADQDAYAEGSKMGFSAKNSANWDSTPEGAKSMFAAASRSQSLHRLKDKAARLRDADEFWQGKK